MVILQVHYLHAPGSIDDIMWPNVRYGMMHVYWRQVVSARQDRTVSKPSVPGALGAWCQLSG